MTASLFYFVLAAGACIGMLWVGVCIWYRRLARRLQAQVHHTDGRWAPAEEPHVLLGNMPVVYSAANRLDAYNGFHHRLGEIVNIFWMWRSQVSVAAYSMAWRILSSNQANYAKRRPNSILQRLFGLSVLSENGPAWRRHRALMNDIFSAARVSRFHAVFVWHTGRFAERWHDTVSKAGGAMELDILPDFTALFLDIIGHAALAHQFGALGGAADRFLEALSFIVAQSTKPANEFTRWWKHVPTAANRRLRTAFATVDEFLFTLIRERREGRGTSQERGPNLLDSLLEATNPEYAALPLTDREVRDNLLAIIVNGHQTVAIGASLSLYLLARHPDKLALARAEVDRVLGPEENFPQSAISQLVYLDCAITESLRLLPPMTGFQRISVAADVLDGWCIPPRQTVGISLAPLHADPAYFGEGPDQFRPERYDTSTSAAACPFARGPRHALLAGSKTRAGVYLPLTFGAGSRRCLGEHFAMHEMKVVLAVLLHRFDFRLNGDFTPNIELDKFGLFVSMYPTNGVRLTIARRQARPAPVASS